MQCLVMNNLIDKIYHHDVQKQNNAIQKPHDGAVDMACKHWCKLHNAERTLDVRPMFLSHINSHMKMWSSYHFSCSIKNSRKALLLKIRKSCQYPILIDLSMHSLQNLCRHSITVRVFLIIPVHAKEIVRCLAYQNSSYYGSR